MFLEEGDDATAMGTDVPTVEEKEEGTEDTDTETTTPAEPAM